MLIMQEGERICKCSGGKNQGVFPIFQFDNRVPISGVVRKKYPPSSKTFEILLIEILHLLHVL